jgi:hypothetical protein
LGRALGDAVANKPPVPPLPAAMDLDELTESLHKYANASQGTLSERIAIIDARTGNLLADYAQELELDASGDMSTWAHKLKQGSGFSNADTFDQYGNMHPDNSILHFHTHPRDSTFSDGDWRVFARSTIDEMRVVTPDAVYHIKKTQSFNDLHWTAKTPSVITENYEKILNEVFDENPFAEVEDMLTEATKRMAKHFGVEYKTIRRQ